MKIHWQNRVICLFYLFSGYHSASGSQSNFHHQFCAPLQPIYIQTAVKHYHTGFGQQMLRTLLQKKVL